VSQGVSRGLAHRLERDLERTRLLESSGQLCLGHLELRPSLVSLLFQRMFHPNRHSSVRRNAISFKGFTA
jgi:hypothetical protein